MVARKYLCAAPHPSTWDDRAVALLKSLGDDPAKREKALRQTLANLFEIHSDKKRKGPGRKSNAEHAINFYNYVLELNAEGDSDNSDEDESESEEEQAELEEEEKESAKEKESEASPAKDGGSEQGKTEAKRRSRPAKKRRLLIQEEGMDNDESTAGETMDSQEFLSQHNDLCDVCNECGDLLCCSTCNLVFHLKCVRPALTELPEGKWICAYCIMAGVGNFRRRARARKNAASAVRQMARVRNAIMKEKNIANNDEADSERDDEDEAKPAAKEDESNQKEPQNTTNDASAEPKIENSAKSAEIGKPSGDSGDASGKEGTAEKDEEVKSNKDEEPVRQDIDTPEQGLSGKKMDTTRPAKATGKEDEESERAEGVKEPDATEKVDSKSCFEEPGDATKKGRENAEESCGDDETGKGDGGAAKSDSGDAEDESDIPSDQKAETTDSTTGKRRKARRNLALYKITDGLSSKELAGTGRTRRERRQVTLYDPQNFRASAWQSDELVQWKSLMESRSRATSSSENETSASENDSTGSGDGKEGKEDGSEDTGSKGDSDAEKTNAIAATEDSDEDTRENTVLARREKKGKEKFWCNFCRDNPAITVCCFCACRVCFGKHSSDKILLCDLCDEEYHTYCLDPPLKSVPSTRKWFCPSCETTKKSASSPRATTRASKTSSTPPRRSTAAARRGRKKALSPSKRRNTDSVSSTVTNSSAATARTKSKSPTGRPRGRPPKNPVPTPSPRKRGRPPASLSPPGRKRGRPPRSISPVPEKSSGADSYRGRGRSRGRGRTPLAKSRSPSLVGGRSGSASRDAAGMSPVAKVGVATPAAEKPTRTNATPRRMDNASERTPADSTTEGAAAVDVPVTVSRSGRMVKRSSFHDEVDGPQSRSARYTQELRRKTEAEAVRKKAEALEAQQQKAPPESLTEPVSEPRVKQARRPVKKPAPKPVAVKPVADPKPQNLDSIPVAALVATPAPGPAAAPLPTPAPKAVPKTAPTSIPAPKPVQPPRPASAPAVMSSPADTTPRSQSEGQISLPSTVATVMEEAVKTAVAIAPTTVPANVEAKSEVVETHVAPTSSAGQNIPQMPLQLTAETQVAASAPRTSAAPTVTADLPESKPDSSAAAASSAIKVPRRKPGARECMQISRRFGNRVIPERYMETLLDYCKRGKVEHLIRMRERLDEHSRYLEAQLAGLEALVQEKGESDVVVPAMPVRREDRSRSDPAGNLMG